MSNLKQMETLLKIIDPQYTDPLTREETISLERKRTYTEILKLAEKNGLKFHILKTLKNLDLPPGVTEIHGHDNEFKRKQLFKSTIQFLNRISKDNCIDYALIKSFDTIEHTPNDIDIFVLPEQRSNLIFALKQNGMSCQQSSIAETKLEGKYMNIDIYTEVCYLNFNFLEGQDLWEARIKKSFLGEKYFGLNPDADYLLLLPHSLFGHRRMTLLDFLHLKNLQTKIDLEKCRDYAKQQGWGYIFDAMTDLLNSMYEDIYLNRKVKMFPFYYPKAFIWDNIKHLQNDEIENKKRLYFELSYLLEEVMYKCEDTFIYRSIKSFGPAQKIFNSACSLAKKERGDRKSAE